MKLRFIEKKQIQESVYSFVFGSQEPLQWQTGQYMHYVVQHPNADDRGIERWFTISSAPYEKNIMLTTRIAPEQSSSFKEALMLLRPGDNVEADGPKGSFTYRDGDFKHIMIAGGIGITPYRSMLVELAHKDQPINTDLLYANADDNFVFGEELEKIAEQDQTFKIIKFVGTRISEEDFKNYLDQKNALFYLSGPRSMVEGYESLLKNLGFAEDQIMTDYFPGYN